MQPKNNMSCGSGLETCPYMLKLETSSAWRLSSRCRAKCLDCGIEAYDGRVVCWVNICLPGTGDINELLGHCRDHCKLPSGSSIFVYNHRNWLSRGKRPPVHRQLKSSASRAHCLSRSIAMLNGYVSKCGDPKVSSKNTHLYCL